MIIMTSTMMMMIVIILPRRCNFSLLQIVFTIWLCGDKNESKWNPRNINDQLMSFRVLWLGLLMSIELYSFKRSYDPESDLPFSWTAQLLESHFPDNFRLPIRVEKRRPITGKMGDVLGRKHFRGAKLSNWIESNPIELVGVPIYVLLRVLNDLATLLGDPGYSDVLIVRFRYRKVKLFLRWKE